MLLFLSFCSSFHVFSFLPILHPQLKFLFDVTSLGRHCECFEISKLFQSKWDIWYELRYNWFISHKSTFWQRFNTWEVRNCNSSDPLHFKEKQPTLFDLYSRRTPWAPTIPLGKTFESILIPCAMCQQKTQTYPLTITIQRPKRHHKRAQPNATQPNSTQPDPTRPNPTHLSATLPIEEDQPHSLGTAPLHATPRGMDLTHDLSTTVHQAR